MATKLKDSPYWSLVSKENIRGLSRAGQQEITMDKAETPEVYRKYIAFDMLHIFLAAKVPITLWGPYGVGKTQTIKALSKLKDTNGVPFKVFMLVASTEEPTNMWGQQYTTKEYDAENREITVMKRSLPQLLEQIVRYHNETGGYVILFIDEITTCAPMQQWAILGLLAGTDIPGHPELDLSELVTICLAANPPDVVEDLIPLGEQVINRGGHIPWWEEVDQYIEGYSSGWGNEHLLPDAFASSIIENWASSCKDVLFKGEWRWDNLVPWDRFGSSPRSVSHLSDVITVIGHVFAESAQEVRDTYIVEACRALISNNQGEVTKMRETLQALKIVPSVISSASSSHGAVRANPLVSLLDGLQSEINSATTEEALREVGHRIHRIGENPMDQASFLRSVESLYDEFTTDSNPKTTWRLWAFLTTSPSDAYADGAIHIAAAFYQVVSLKVRDGVLDRDKAKPSFVPDRYTRRLSEYIRAQSTAESSRAAVSSQG